MNEEESKKVARTVPCADAPSSSEPRTEDCADHVAAANLLEAAFFGMSSEEDMDQAAVDLSADLPLIEGYKLIRLLGEGGFGMVYEAEQRVPIRRRVALKVLRPGCTTRELLVRFEQERQALALMNHPHIARIYDAGETEDGRPFIAMEMVDGQTIDKRAKSLPQRDRVSLMLDVSRAVAHAHHKGIIHRDLKPSNILITDNHGKPEPRVIDFGIAKALDGPLVTKVMFTQIRQVVGTPGYMSPERQHTSQISQSADTRTDVFALGAILWELLSGSTPLQSPDGSSTRVTLPNARGIPNELRWITEKATDPDMDLRYANADGLADDLAAWLEGQPLKAAPRSTLYVISKWAARHRSAAVVSVLLLVTLIASLLLLTGKNLEIRRALQQAEQNHTETLRRSSNESYLMGVTRERRRPTLALAHWAHALRQDPQNQAALGIALATLRHRSHPAVIAPVTPLPAGKVRLLQVSTNGQWVAVVMEVEKGEILVRARRGAPQAEAFPIPADGKIAHLAVSSAGHVAVAGNRGPVGLLQKDGTWQASELDVEGLRLLAWTAEEKLWCVAVQNVSQFSAAGEATMATSVLPGREWRSAASIDGNQVAVGTEGGRILLFGTDDASSPSVLQAPIPAPFSGLAVDANGQRVAAAWRSGDVWLNHGDGRTSAYVTSDTVLNLSFLRDESALWIRQPSAISLWNPLSGGLARTFSNEDPLKTLLPVGGAAVLMQANFRRPSVLDFSDDSMIAEDISGMEGRVTCAADPSSRVMVFAHEDHLVIEWMQLVAKVERPELKSADYEWLALVVADNGMDWRAVSSKGKVCQVSPKGEVKTLWQRGTEALRLACVSRDAQAVLADTADGAGVALCRPKVDPKVFSWGKPSALALSPSGKLAALGYPAGEVRLFDLTTEQECFVRDWQRGAIHQICFISDERLAVAVSGLVQICDWKNNRLLPTPIELGGTIVSLSACGAGERLAALGSNGALHVVDVNTGRRVLGQMSAPNTSSRLAWSPDDAILWCFTAKGLAKGVPMPPLLKQSPEWFPSWLEHHVGIKIDDDGNATRLRSTDRSALPKGLDARLQDWLTAAP
ncbi:MAG: protein kinase [Verrucomicrobiaceae bacterium]|nr:protein kinase [Verrucomicrobiaceae bacterium]